MIGRWWRRWKRFLGVGLGTNELARRLGFTAVELSAVRPVYRAFQLPKRGGGHRRILAPEAELRALQRRILRRLLASLKVHPAAAGFERGQSIVTHARRHAGRALLVHFDLREFFASTHADRVRDYFLRLGWNRHAADQLVSWCTTDGGLPQGAPTSPRLSNLVNYRLDARLAGLARRCDAVYSRYADDLTFSFASDQPHELCRLLTSVPAILRDFGYRINRRKRVHVCRRHQRQQVTGLVVNHRPALPRETRHWLRAVEHRHRQQAAAASSLHLASQSPHPSAPPTLTAEQLAGWRALRTMISRQSANGAASADV